MWETSFGRVLTIDQITILVIVRQWAILRPEDAWMSEGTSSAPDRRLITAAEAQFRRFGYRRTTVDDITADAGTGKGSLYLHFESKQAVYMAVVEASLERFVEAASKLLESGGPVPVRLRALVELTIDHYGSDELLYASLFGKAGLVDGDVARMAADVQRQRIRQLLRELLALGREEGSVRADIDVDASAAVLFEIGWAVVRRALEGDSEIPLERALTTLNQIVGLGLLPRHP
jgi:AcrR family transcriptional regulator